MPPTDWRFPDLPPKAQAWLENNINATFDELEGKNLTPEQNKRLIGAYETQAWLAAYRRGEL